ncbi:MAG: hypothetical protein MJZ88_01815 [Paludibacteraceae bacterium]|nr:hypothetical protein [Candidatus Colicola coprequi]MCQ2333331.1 hypothetical protein [Paludibacteraceae bacterium]
MKQVFWMIIIGLGMVVSAQAQSRPQAPQRVPAYRGVIERVQPTGDTLHIYLRGDERKHYTITIDGWQVRENKKGVLCYARKFFGFVKSSRYVAHDEHLRTDEEKNYLRRKGIKKDL